MSRKTILFEQHQLQGAQFIDFAGWQMPLHYGSLLGEHHCVRKKAGVFDVSHMLAMDINGIDAQLFLKKILANDIQKLTQPGKGLYSCLLNSMGGVKDDLIVYRLAENEYRLVVNAATRESDQQWIIQHSKDFEVTCNMRVDLAILALQGPDIVRKIAPIFSLKNYTAICELKRFHCYKIKDWMIARTGYTGEDGFEIILPQTDAVSLWQQILAQQISPIGLGARDTLRLEAGLNLYGQDMDESVTPYESNLGWTVDLGDDSRDFIGKKALLVKKEQILSQLVGLILKENGVCRTGFFVYSSDTPESLPIGRLTSGGYSPTLECGIALARVDNPISSEYFVEIRNKRVRAQKILLPFIKNGKANFQE